MSPPGPNNPISADDGRSSQRTSLFLAATIEAAEESWAVRLRNMSATGALAEGSCLPTAGQAVTVKRGMLSAAAKVVWSRPGSCGVQFESRITVGDWMPNRTAELGSAGQRRTDRVQEQIRRGYVPLADNRRAKVATPPEVIRRRMAEELEYVQRGLDQMAEKFASDPYILARHTDTLQQFDVLDRILDHLKKLTVAEDPAAEAHEIGMVELRRRLLR